MGSGSYIAFAGICGTIPLFFNTTIPLECLPDHLKATGATLLLAIGELAGSAGLSLVGGYIAGLAGYGATMLFTTILLSLAFCLTFTLKESNPTFL